MQELNVTIRPLELGDAEGVQRYASEELVARTTSIPHPYPTGSGEKFVKAKIDAREKREAFPFAVIVNGEMIGVVDLNRADFETRKIHVDYGIASSYWGKGIMTQVVACAVDYAFKELQMETVYSACLERNPGSRRVLEKNGFLKTDSFIYNGSKFKGEPGYRFKLTRQEWEAKHSKEQR